MPANMVRTFCACSLCFAIRSSVTVKPYPASHWLRRGCEVLVLYLGLTADGAEVAATFLWIFSEGPSSLVIASPSPTATSAGVEEKRRDARACISEGDS